MEWLNLHVSVLDCPEFLGAEPVDRATWLCLLRYCAGQENGGRIVNAASWGDRRWQQLCRVTAKEVRRTCDLWAWDGADLLVVRYPSDKEAEVRAKRQGGKDTADKRWGKRRSSGAESDSSAIEKQRANLDAEGKGREGKGKEGNCDGVADPGDLTSGAPKPQPLKVVPVCFLDWWPTHPRCGGAGKDRQLWDALFHRAGREVMDAAYAALTAAKPDAPIWVSEMATWIDARYVEA